MSDLHNYAQAAKRIRECMECAGIDYSIPVVTKHRKQLEKVADAMVNCRLVRATHTSRGIAFSAMGKYESHIASITREDK